MGKDEDDGDERHFSRIKNTYFKIFKLIKKLRRVVLRGKLHEFR